MAYLKVAVGSVPMSCFATTRPCVLLDLSDLTDVGAVVLSAEDLEQGVLDTLAATGLSMPVFVVARADCRLPAGVFGRIHGVFEPGRQSVEHYGRQIDTAILQYEADLLPPFFSALKSYVEAGHSAFDCPGHQGGQFFRKHPAGRQFFDFFGENIFRADLCNADVKLGDLLIHEGPAHAAQAYAARVFNADKTYFVLNGTSASNKVVANALLSRGDLVLFDRNNHKSNHYGALTQAGATPIYLETARNPFGFIGGIDAHCFDEAWLRARIHAVDPARATAERPFRLAIIQLGTYDGTVYNARQVIDKIGHLCDYVLFDSAWVGYEQFIPMMKDCSPLLLSLTDKDPGIIVTQSVHKQLAGFSQTSQIHKKDQHINGQARYCDHKRFNNAFMLHASTSPFYPLFAALDMNARMHDGPLGRKLWLDCVKLGIEARKLVLENCQWIRPFVPRQIDGKPWQDYPTSQMAEDLRFFAFAPGDQWHAFEGYAEGQYFVDPCKLLLTTPGIDSETGQYTAFGVPATILAHYLRENHIVPEKCDLNSILFLLTPAEDMGKIQDLMVHLVRFEQYLAEDAPLAEVLPSMLASHPSRYQGYTLRQLCQEMHDLYVSHDVKQLQKDMFRQDQLPVVRMNPQEANTALVRGQVALIPLADAEGRIAAEGALPYPPGVLCIVPGEVWDGAVWHYFMALEDGINRLPGFAPELQGVYLETTASGRKQVYGYVLDASATGG